MTAWRPGLSAAERLGDGEAQAMLLGDAGLRLAVSGDLDGAEAMASR